MNTYTEIFGLLIITIFMFELIIHYCELEIKTMKDIGKK